MNKRSPQRRRPTPVAGERPRQVRWVPVLSLAGVVAVAAVLYVAFRPLDVPSLLEAQRQRRLDNPRGLAIGNLTVLWDHPTSEPQVPPAVSNIRPQDYAGPESCRKCHEANYDSWSQHPHRWMNALAGPDTVKGDFSGQASIDYKGGKATFFQEDGQYRMRLERGSVTRLYEIHQTIGSRFFQYYVGVGLQGPEPPGHGYYQHDHVLPFGYWLDEQMWVPIVHVSDELPDEQRIDPFAAVQTENPAELPFIYAQECNFCHTTFALADMCVRYPELIGDSAPQSMQLLLAQYLADARPDIWDGTEHPADADDQLFSDVLRTLHGMDARQHAVTLGVSCEACHLGCKAHVEGNQPMPPFLPVSPHLNMPEVTLAQQGRNRANANWVCSRCHNGVRPLFAAGMSTWNSTEFTDAKRGGCYSQLTCIQCHDPHEPIGPVWTRTAEQDDQSCLACHQHLVAEQPRMAHTHHPMGSEGSRCMNCHMPRINEGLQDVVRTHTIFSPTNAAMIEANHPNACNLCHLDKPIDWTLDYLADWYGASYDPTRLNASYPHRKRETGLGWLLHPHESVRLVAVEALGRRQATWALDAMIDVLDDDYLLNRQFAYKAIERMTGVQLEPFGYRFYMQRDERRQPLARIRKQLLQNDTAN